MSKTLPRMVMEKEEEVLGWTSCLPDDAAIAIFSRLNYRDRASLSSTCRSWRAVGNSPYLWQDLDLRSYNFDAETASSLASRCKNLRKLRFRCPESADAIINLQAKNLRELSVYRSRRVMTDVTLSLLAARHEALECLQILSACTIFSCAVKAIAICCPQLKRLWISDVSEVDANTINAFAKNCKNLMDIGFVDCGMVDETALGNVVSVRFLSVAGTTFSNWQQVVRSWSTLPCLIGLDVSGTDIPLDAVSGFFSSSFSLKVLCALNCPELEGDIATFVSNGDRNGKVLVSVFTDILATYNSNCNKDSEISSWLERIISSSILRRKPRHSPEGLGNFWLNQGTDFLLSFSQSAHEEVQERAVMALANIFAYNENRFGDDTEWAQKAVMRGGDGVRLFLNLARSWREGLQSGAAKAIAKLSVNDKVAKAVLDEGGISILANLATSANRTVAKQALGALSNLSVKEELKCPIDEAIGVKTLVDLVARWSKSVYGERFLEHVVGVLANLATVDKCRAEIASVGGVNALMKLTHTCMEERVVEKAVHIFNNLTAHGDDAGVGLDAEAFDALVQLTRSRHDGVRKEAACALCNFCCDDRNQEAIAGTEGVQALVALANSCSNDDVGLGSRAFDALVQLTRSRHDGVRKEAASALSDLCFDDGTRDAIAAAGGVEASVALAISCSNASPELKLSAAGALWGLSYSEAHSIAICQEGGVEPLVELAQSDNVDVQEAAVSALWNLCFFPNSAPSIIEEGGIDVIARVSSNSPSNLVRLMCVLALTLMLDQRMDDEIASMGTCTESVELERVKSLAMKHVEDFVKTVSDTQLFSAAATSLDPALLMQLIQFTRIPEADQLFCSEAEITRLAAMLQNPCPTLKSCAAFALLQNGNGEEHVRFLENAGAQAVLQAAAEDEEAPLVLKIFARPVLRNMEWFTNEKSPESQITAL